MLLAVVVMLVDLLESTSIARWAGRGAQGKGRPRRLRCVPHLRLRVVSRWPCRSGSLRSRHSRRPFPRSALARKNGYALAYNQEVVGLGLANFAGAMFCSYTTTGSFSRSAVNNASGARGPGGGVGVSGAGPGTHAGLDAAAHRARARCACPPVRRSAGAKTQLAGFVTSMVVMLVLLFLTPVFSKL